jgi:hypothetical protein
MLKYILGLAPLILGLLLGIALSSTAEMGLDEARAPNGFISGNDWLGLNKTEQATYAMGVADGLDLAATLKTPGLFWINPCVAGMTSDQLRAMLKAELDARPGERHLPMVHRAVYQALWKACRHSPER